jgi:hypothetical protein
MASSKRVTDLFKQQTWKQSKLLEMNKVLYRLLTAICSKGKRVSESMITENAKSVTDKCMFPEGSNKNLPISIAYILPDNLAPVSPVGAILNNYCILHFKNVNNSEVL